MRTQHRSASQILFGFLPEQTVDLQGQVWKVARWVNPVRSPVDKATIRRELRRQAAPWASTGRDRGYREHLLHGHEVEVWSLNTEFGVRVDSYPEVWVCKRCRRVVTRSPATCRCGAKSWGQLPFVGYHACGALREPYIRRCQQHDDVEVLLPGTASAGEIVFRCPRCHRQTQKGFGFPPCECGDGRMVFNVHRAASVYTPRGVVVVNPPSPERVRQLDRAGGASRALAWVIAGMNDRWVDGGGHSRATFVEQLLAQGIDRALAEKFADEAAAAGQIADERGPVLEGLPNREEAENQAVAVAMATSEARVTVQDLTAATEEWTTLGELYRTTYPRALRRAGLESVELVDRFPVLTGNFGFTRGDPKPGESTLVPYRNPRGGYVVYADVSDTEALFVKLDPVAVARWLMARGRHLPEWRDAESARSAVIATCEIPGVGDRVASAGGDVLELVHSYAHRFVRRAAVFAGIERTALAELLVPLHLGFFVYAAARGDFVLGGLQALFETELDQVLGDVVAAEHRCPLDPGCQRAGGACMACMHLGEPSCRLFNTYLDRAILFGANGYLVGSSRATP